MRLILASTSPRRQHILALLGLPFAVMQPDFEEIVTCERSIEDEVLYFSLGKAESVAGKNPQAVVIGSDTMISIDREKIGKPRSAADAGRMLRTLAGRIHHIWTGVAIIDGLGGPGLEAVEKVKVKMRDLSDADVEDYLACKESLDKAGAYSIQGEGRHLIETLEGDYFAAVGLPLKLVAEYLNNRGFVLPFNVDTLYTEKSFLNWKNL